MTNIWKFCGKVKNYLYLAINLKVINWKLDLSEKFLMISSIETYYVIFYMFWVKMKMKLSSISKEEFLIWCIETSALKMTCQNTPKISNVPWTSIHLTWSTFVVGITSPWDGTKSLVFNVVNTLMHKQTITDNLTCFWNKPL